MNNIQSIRHTVWECKYHLVWIPTCLRRVRRGRQECRRKVLYGQLRQSLGEILRELVRQRESQVEEGHLRPDHVHMLVSIPPKYAVSEVVGYVKGKSAIYIARNFVSRRRNSCLPACALPVCVRATARTGRRAGKRATHRQVGGEKFLGKRLLCFHGRRG